MSRAPGSQYHEIHVGCNFGAGGITGARLVLFLPLCFEIVSGSVGSIDELLTGHLHLDFVQTTISPSPRLRASPYRSVVS